MKYQAKFEKFCARTLTEIVLNKCYSKSSLHDSTLSNFSKLENSFIFKQSVTGTAKCGSPEAQEADEDQRRARGGRIFL